MAETEKGLLEELKKMIEGLTKQEGRGGGDEGPVPYKRFSEVNERYKDAVAGLEEMTAKVAELEKAHKAELKEIKEAAAKQVADLQMRHQEDIVFSRHNIDDVGQATIRAAYGTLDEKGRPETAAAWLESLAQAAKAHAEDPKKNAAPEAHASVLGLIKVEAKQETRKGSPEGGSAPKRGDGTWSGMTRAEMLADSNWRGE